jgi:hypothetical protein
MMDQEVAAKKKKKKPTQSQLKEYFVLSVGINWGVVYVAKCHTEHMHLFVPSIPFVICQRQM